MKFVKHALGVAVFTAIVGVGMALGARVTVKIASHAFGTRIGLHASKPVGILFPKFVAFVGRDELCPYTFLLCSEWVAKFFRMSGGVGASPAIDPETLLLCGVAAECPRGKGFDRDVSWPSAARAVAEVRQKLVATASLAKVCDGGSIGIRSAARRVEVKVAA